MKRENALDISSYLIVGPENTQGRPVADIVRMAVEQGFTCVQIRSKVASARELIGLCGKAAEAIASAGKSNSVTLLVNDRLDVVLAARSQGIKVDGIHVGQQDVPPDICRKYLGEDAIIGLSARTNELLDFVRQFDTQDIDYFGAGPLHPTASKPDAGVAADGSRHTRTIAELTELHRISPVPVVVGGGVKAADLPALKAAGVDGFFVISAVAGADNPAAAARELTELWKRL
ncbi:MAG: thiamine phosphate synthase [Selenomonas sp.]|uniref:thiamine phosphate synthase n=1 Tax=Selenomonas sp. TaxID=2053611 RepID=UPI0025CC72D3|nr:thiamine phosphate synthase [Selenomonas sp.]MCR5438427.1 thiamine phosphate synthase [Selenomonas sp.]